MAICNIHSSPGLPISEILPCDRDNVYLVYIIIPWHDRVPVKGPTNPNYCGWPKTILRSHFYKQRQG